MLPAAGGRGRDVTIFCQVRPVPASSTFSPSPRKRTVPVFQTDHPLDAEQRCCNVEPGSAQRALKRQPYPATRLPTGATVTDFEGHTHYSTTRPCRTTRLPTTCWTALVTICQITRAGATPTSREGQRPVVQRPDSKFATRDNYAAFLDGNNSCPDD